MRFIHFKGLKDLAMLVSSTASWGVVQRLSLMVGRLYFIIGGALCDVFLYFVKLREEVDGRCIVYNTLSGEIVFSQRVRTNLNLSSIPTLEIVNRELFQRNSL